MKHQNTCMQIAESSEMSSLHKRIYLHQKCIDPFPGSPLETTMFRQDSRHQTVQVAYIIGSGAGGGGIGTPCPLVFCKEGSNSHVPSLKLNT